MQPYFFPYIGYFQLIKAVDLFVIYDDVNFIKQGWITRNRILLDNKIFNITLKVKGASSFQKINQIEVYPDNKKLLKTIEHAYKKAPQFLLAFPVICEVLNHDEKSLSKKLGYSLQKICEYIGIGTKIIFSSDLKKVDNLGGQERVIDICKIFNAADYFNPIGGVELYNRNEFLVHGINLHFVK